MEERDLALRRSTGGLSTVCGFYRFAHIDGRVGANPAQYVRRPKVHPSEGRGLDRREFGTFLFTAERFDQVHAALAVLLGLNGLRVSEACGTNIEDLAFDRGHRTLRIMGKGSKPAVIPLVPRAARTIDLAIGERSEGPILRRQDGQRLDRRTAHRWVRSIGKRAGLGSSIPTCSGQPSSWRPSMPEFRFVTSRSRLATPIRGPTTIYDRRTGELRPACRLRRGGVRRWWVEGTCLFELPHSEGALSQPSVGTSRTSRRSAIEVATSSTDRPVRSAAALMKISRAKNE